LVRPSSSIHPIHPSTHPFIHSFIHLSAHSSARHHALTALHFTHLNVLPSIRYHLFVIHASMYPLIINPSTHLSILFHLSIHPSVTIHPPKIRSLPCVHHRADHLYLSCDRLVSGSSDSTVRVWDVVEGVEVATLRGHTSRVWEVDTLPSGRCVSASADGTVRVWDPETRACAAVVSGHESDVYVPHPHPHHPYHPHHPHHHHTHARARAHTHTRTPRTCARACFYKHKHTHAHVLTRARAHGHCVCLEPRYTVSGHPGGRHMVSGGYDRSVRLHDIATATTLRVMQGEIANQTRNINTFYFYCSLLTK
jgi:WD40 repeat protein